MKGDRIVADAEAFRRIALPVMIGREHEDFPVVCHNGRLRVVRYIYNTRK